MYVHSKIYVIDRKIAYLGSLNFTDNGFSSNFETRIRITDQHKVGELVDFVHDIFDDHETFKRHKLWFLGKKVYWGGAKINTLPNSNYSFFILQARNAFRVRGRRKANEFTHSSE